jgi:hypothetical protein
VKVSGLDHRFPPPHQKRGHPSPPFSLSMRSESSGGTPCARLSRTLPQVGTLLVLFTLAALLAVSPVRAAYGGADSETYEWTNGSVLCVFDATLPSVTVSATDLNHTGMGAGMDQINEISPTGTVVASALMTSAAWDPSNNSTSQWFIMNYSEPVNVTSPGNPSNVLGLTWITITFALDRTPANATLADEVNFQLAIQEWPWLNSSDTLSLVVPVWSAFSTVEHVVVGSPNPARVESVRNSTGQPLEFFEAGTSATTGTGQAVAVSAATTVSAAGVATTTLTLGHGAGGASALTYAATLGITPSTRVLGLPLYDYAAVAGGAGLVALAVGVGTRRVRRHPSDLTYVEEPQ